MVAIEKNGEIKVFPNIPDTWNHTIGYPYEDATIHYIDGFRNVVEPQYNTATQRKGAMVYDNVNNVFTYEVVNLTEEELTAKEEIEDKSDQQVLTDKGQRLYEKTKSRLIRRNKKGLITKARCKKVREYLHPIFLLLNTGDIDIANDKALLLTVDVNADVNNELVWFKAEIAQLKLDVNTLL